MIRDPPHLLLSSTYSKGHVEVNVFYCWDKWPSLKKSHYIAKYQNYFQREYKKNATHNDLSRFYQTSFQVNITNKCTYYTLKKHKLSSVFCVYNKRQRAVFVYHTYCKQLVPCVLDSLAYILLRDNYTNQPIKYLA